VSNDEWIYDGRRAVGLLRDLGHGVEVWTADREAVGKFPSYEIAYRALLEHDRKQRAGAG
jgi:hypothetical protein